MRHASAALGPAGQDPRRYVQRFGFTADNVLQVGFDSASVDELLSNAGLPIWGRERPATLVLLASMTDSSAASSMRSELGAEAGDRADGALRGLPLKWPRLELERFEDVWSERQGRCRSRPSDMAPMRCSWPRAQLERERQVHWTLMSAAKDDWQASGGIEEGVHLRGRHVRARVRRFGHHSLGRCHRRGHWHRRSRRLCARAELPGRHDAGARPRGGTGRGRYDALRARRAR